MRLNKRVSGVLVKCLIGLVGLQELCQWPKLEEQLVVALSAGTECCTGCGGRTPFRAGPEVGLGGYFLCSEEQNFWIQSQSRAR